MASSSGKPTAVHFSLIIFVMLTFIVGAIAFLSFKDAGEKGKELAAAKDALTKQKTLASNYLDDITAMKKRLGHIHDNIGREFGPNGEHPPNSVLGAVADDIHIYGGFSQTMPANQLPNIHEVLLKLRTERDTLQRDYNRVNATLQDRNTAFINFESVKQIVIDAHKKGQTDAEAIRNTVQTQQKERLDAADKLARDKTLELAQAKNEHQQELEALQKEIANLTQERKDLIVINDRFKEKIDKLQRVSFEKSDGEIRWVDHVSRLVWINVGSDDRLSKRTTFSVYKKGHDGIGRGAEDIKGAIEVTRIIGPHLAEARILDANIYEPIAPGDPIYTPLWSPGRSESFSIVGFVDLDGDGHSDMELLREIVAAAGGRFDNVVDDLGIRTGEKITVQTKFLIVAELPDPTVTSDEEEKKTFLEILKIFGDMEKEARTQGVRKVSLGDFLAYIGYRPQRRLWHPGDGSPYKLSNGAHSTATRQFPGNLKSSGQTSGVYTRSKRLKQPTSSGQTSKVFRGGGSGY